MTSVIRKHTQRGLLWLALFAPVVASAQVDPVKRDLIQFGYNQQDASSFNDSATFTTSTSVSEAYTIAIADTVPGTPVPVPINAPAITVILTFPGNQDWSWEAFNIYVIDQHGAGTWS